MRVIAAINGSITAESMAFYALKYAQVQNLTLVLLHVENKKDDLDDVHASMQRIATISESQNIKTERVLLSGSIQKSVKLFLSNGFTDTIFCSTRKNKNLLSNSFSLLLTKMNLNVDIAIVRIVKISSIMDLSSVMLSIKEDRLSVEKFTFFSTIALAFKAEGEIYSVSSMSIRELSMVDMHKAREKLGIINHNLRHYLKLANIMNFPLNIKHDFTNSESKSIFTHIVKSNAQLVVIGAKRLSITSFLNKEMPIEKLMREASVNTIAYYPKEN